jgi:NAD+ kinase
MAGRALLFINQNKTEALELARCIGICLRKRSYHVSSFSYQRNYRDGTAALSGAPDFSASAEHFDIGMSLGGDGTVLFAARALAPLGTPVLPVNLGTLGFVAGVLPEHWEEAFAEWEAGKAVVSRRLMLNVNVEREGRTVFEGACLNDAVVSASGIAKLIRLEAEAETAGGEHIDLGRFRSDGLIIATPTGSTGYSAAAGGPVADPEMELVIINPICPFTLSNRPIVLPSGDRVIITVEQEQRNSVLLTVDGQITEPLEPGDRVITSQAPYRAQLVASGRGVFYRALRTKLGWSGGTSHAAYQGGADA